MQGRRRVDRVVTGVTNDVDTGAQLVAPVASYRVRTAAIEALIGRHVGDGDPGEIDVARENRPAANPPCKHRGPPQGVILRDLDFAPVEFVGRLRSDQARRVQERRGGDTALGRVEEAVHPIAHRTDRHRAEPPPVTEEFAARLVAQPEQTAVDPVRRERPSDGIRVSDGDGKPAAGVEREIGVSADRLASIDAELGAPLRDETQGGHVGAGQERRLSERYAERVIQRIDRPRAGERIAKLIESRRVRGCAGPQLRHTSRQIERARAAQEVMCRPAALHAEALHCRVAEADAYLVGGTFQDLDEGAHHRVALDRFLGRDGIEERDVDRTEHPHAVEIALCLIQRVLLEQVTGPHRHDAPHRTGVHVTEPADHHLADAHARTGLRIQLHFRLQDSRFGIEVSQHVGVGIPAVAQSSDDRVRRRLHEETIEGITDLQREVALQLLDVENSVQTHDVEPRDPNRLALVNSERDIHVAGCAPHRRVHHGVHEPALPIEENETDDVAAEFDFVEIALLTKSQPANDAVSSPGARFGRGDRALERVVVERSVTDKRQTPNHPLLFLSGEDGCRYQGGEQQAGYDAQLT